MYDFTGQTVLVTGGAQGIGFGIALELARAGSRVVIADMDLDKAHAAAKEIQQIGADAAALVLDVMDEESVDKCVASSIERFGRIDVLVNNAGIHCETVGQVSTVRHFKQCFDVNLFGVWRMTQALVPHFRAHGGGKIVNVASINGRKPWVDTPAYSASKAAVINLTQSLAAKLGADNINVNAVCPGGVLTAMANQFTQDLPAMLQTMIRSRVLKRELFPEDIGHAVVFFASAQAGSITGQALNVDCGTVMT
jgi:NAD(P)-dependent dehydrogenase (short-subunit alcohol dehydrogenase family)